MRVLLAVDGSGPSLEAARALAHLSPLEEVVVLHAVETPAAFFVSGPEVMLGDATVAQRAMEERAQDVLDRTVAALPKVADTVTCRIEHGSPADAILHAADRERVDLIVLGARGLGRIEEIVVGSVSHRVLHHAPCAAWVVHDPVAHVRRILLPLAGEPDAEAALRFFSKRPFPLTAELRVLSVVPLTDPLWPLEAVRREALVQEQIGHATRFVQDVALKLTALGYWAGGSTGLGWPSEAILQEATAQQADLVAMGSRRQAGVKRLLVGSVSHAVLHRAKPSVLLFH